MKTTVYESLAGLAVVNVVENQVRDFLGTKKNFAVKEPRYGLLEVRVKGEYAGSTDTTGHFDRPSS